MRSKPNIGLVLCLLITGSASALASGGQGKSIPFSTQSDEAKQYIREFVLAVESFQPPNKLTELAQKAVDLDPNFAFAHYALSVAQPTPAQAQAELDKALELSAKANEGEREYIHAMSLVRAQTPDLEGALAIFAKLRKEYPGDRMVPMLMGQIHSNQGKNKEALEDFTAAAQIDDSTPRVHAFLGNLLLVDGKFEKARSWFEKSLAMSSKDTAPFFPYVGPAFADLYEGNVDAALKQVDTYLEAYNRTGGPQVFPAVFIWNLKARINLEHNRTEEALRCYKSGVETLEGSSIPDDQKQIWTGRFIHGKARTLAKMGRFEEARAEAAKVEKMIEEGGEQGKQFLDALHYLKAYIDLEAGEYAKTVEHLTQIQQPNDFHKAMLARAYEKLGENDKAISTYREIVASGQNTVERALVYREAQKKLAASTPS